MGMQIHGLTAYNKALSDFQNTQKTVAKATVDLNREVSIDPKSFGTTLTESLTEVNNLQKTKNTMITAFASGETQNVHELMISMQKASVAVSMTSAVRNKVLEAYKEMSKIQF